jgi:hypothetical protein
MVKTIIAFSILSFAINAATTISGVKSPNPNEKEEKNLAPISSKALLPDQNDFKGGFNFFLPYMMPSPYQENAGSCLFMSHTAATEVLLGKSQNKKIDLSERYLMNLSKADIGDDLINNWITDTIYRLNATKETYLNKDFPYLKDWYRYEDGLRVFSEPNVQGSYYGVRANWVVALNQLDPKTAIAHRGFSRKVLFEDPKGNRWNVATAPKNIVSTVKKALRSKKGPVVVIYNHTGFWHAVMVAGYNDNVNNQGCGFVTNFQPAMNNRAEQIDQEANEAESNGDYSQAKKLRRKAKLFRRRGATVQESFKKTGGCSGKGAFYVRDSIYPQKGGPLYDYDSNRTGEEQPLNPGVILREYEWLEHMANHVIQISLN